MLSIKKCYFNGIIINRYTNIILRCLPMKTFNSPFKYLLFPMLLLAFAISASADPIKNDNPPICVDSTSFGSAGKVGACFSPMGVFQAGAGCLQTVKLRNLSDDPIDNAVVAIDYNLFNGSADQHCGIDGVDQTGEECNLTRDINFGPFGMFNNAATFNTGNFDSMDTHSIYTKAALSHDFTFLDNHTFIKYSKDGQEYVGPVKKCQVKKNADDLCYAEINPIKKGFGLCFNFGFFSFGMASGGCGKEIVLKNQSDSDLTDVDTSLVAKDLFKGHMIDHCYIDDHKSNDECKQGDVMDFGFMGMSGLFQGSSVTFDPMPDFAPNQNHSISSLSTISMSVFPTSQLYGTYIKDGELYRGEIKACGAPHPPKSYTTGPFDAWDTYRNINDRNISTKIVNKPYNLVLASINASQTNVETKAHIDKVYYGIAKKDQNGRYSSYLVDPTTNPPINFSTDTDVTKNFNISSASSDTRVVFRFCADYNGSAYTLYPPDIKCTGDANIVLWPDEQNIVGWRETVSSDAFAVRPDHFTVENAPTTNQKAGVPFNLKLHAVDVNGNDVRDYNKSIGANAIASPSLDHNDTKPNCQPASRVLNVTGGFRDGVANLNINYNEVGNLHINLTEHNSTDYAHIDLDDTDFNHMIHDSPNHKGSIYREITPASLNITFIPDHFALQNIKLHDHHETLDANFTYLANTPAMHNMAARLDFNVTAKNTTNNTTYNYNSACYAKAITALDIDYRIDNAVANNVNPGVLKTILYSWYDDSMTLNKADGNQTLSSSLTIPSIVKNVFNTDHNGTAKLKVQLNFDRIIKTPVRPFHLFVADINVSNIDGVTDNNTAAKSDKNATFYYARVSPLKDFYPNIIAASVNTPIFIDIYCDISGDLNYTKCNKLGIDTAGGEFTNNHLKWWRSLKHDQSKNDGNVTLKVTTLSGTLNKTKVVIVPGSNAEDKNITVSLPTNVTRPYTVDIDLDTNNPTDTNDWVIYNPKSPVPPMVETAPSPFEQVGFIGNSNWTGHGETGNVVDSNANKKANRRLGW